MRCFFTIFTIFTILIATTACAKPPLQTTCNFELTKYGQRISWGSNIPVVLHPDNSVPNAYLPALNAAAETWNKAIGKKVLVIGAYVPSGDNLISFKFDWDGSSNQEAYTNIYFQQNRLYAVVVRFNLHFLFSTLDIPVADQIDVQSLALHEFGHVLGLSHIDIPGDVMYPSLPTFSLRRELTQVDKDSILCEY